MTAQFEKRTFEGPYGYQPEKKKKFEPIMYSASTSEDLQGYFVQIPRGPSPELELSTLDNPDFGFEYPLFDQINESWNKKKEMIDWNLSCAFELKSEEKYHASSEENKRSGKTRCWTTNHQRNIKKGLSLSSKIHHDLEECYDRDKISSLYKEYKDSKRNFQSLKKIMGEIRAPERSERELPKEEKEINGGSWSSIGPRLCFLLGLKEDTLKVIQTLDEDVLEHRLPEEWVKIFLKGNYDEIESEDKADLTLNILQTLGFEKQRAEMLIEEIPEDIRCHRTTLDWVNIYIEDKFKYHILLSRNLIWECPFEDKPENEWFTLTKKEAKDIGGIEKLPEVPMKKVRENGDGYKTLDGLVFPDGPEDENHLFFFHGTGAEEAVNILSGISLNEGKQCEFSLNGEGFYLNNDFEEAIKYSKKFGKVHVVLVYRVAKDIKERYHGLNLQGDENKRIWKDVCRYHLQKSAKRKRGMKRKLEDVQYIEGPMINKTSSSKNDYENIIPYRISGSDDSYQFCVRSEELAEEMDRCLHKVVFFLPKISK